jgi:hypothetical protein
MTSSSIEIFPAFFGVVVLSQTRAEGKMRPDGRKERTERPNFFTFQITKFAKVLIIT